MYCAKLSNYLYNYILQNYSSTKFVLSSLLSNNNITIHKQYAKHIEKVLCLGLVNFSAVINHGFNPLTPDGKVQFLGFSVGGQIYFPVR